MHCDRVAICVNSIAGAGTKIMYYPHVCVFVHRQVLLRVPQSHRMLNVANPPPPERGIAWGGWVRVAIFCTHIIFNR